MSSTSATSSTGTNFNVANIVSQLMTVEQQPLAVMNQRIASYTAKLSAYSTIKGALTSFQTTVAGLSNITNYQQVNATSSNTSAVTASASATAIKGNYSLNVTNLAQTQSLEAAGQTSQTTAIGAVGTTTLTFDFGTISGGSLTSGTYSGASFASNGNGAKTVTIDSTNNSLQGIAGAINNAGIGVNATIVNDGSATPYRLVLTSTSGAANSMKISAAGDATLSNLLSQDPANNTGQKLAEVTTAKDANFTVNGVAVTSSSNTASSAISGVTLNLLGATTSPVNVSIAQNTSAIGTSIQSFVSAYNGLNSVLQSSSSFNAATGTGAILQGDYSVISLQSQLHAVLNTQVSGISGSITSLADVGVTFQKDGTLGVDTAKLNTAISGNFSGIASLLSTVGSATDTLVSYNASTSSTVPGNYAVNVTSLASKGSTVGNFNLNAAPTVIAANTTINAIVNGTSASVALSAGTYNATQFATMIQSAINGTSAFAGLTVAASINGSGFLNIMSSLYSSASNISVTSNTGTPVSAFMGTATNAAGSDVAGSIGGVATTGSGQYLTATVGNPSGLQVLINGGATGARGTVNFSHGYAYTLNQLATSMLGTGGLLDGATTGLNSSITDLNKQEAALNVRLTALQASYTKQFTALDVSLSNMNSTSTYLTQQLANLPKA